MGLDLPGNGSSETMCVSVSEVKGCNFRDFSVATCKVGPSVEINTRWEIVYRLILYDRLSCQKLLKCIDAYSSNIAKSRGSSPEASERF